MKGLKFCKSVSKLIFSLLPYLLQIGSVQLSHISAHYQICHTQYTFLTHADDLLCLQLHTVGSLIPLHCILLILVH